MRHIRRAFPITIGLATAAACALLACSDDDTSVTPAPDAGTPTGDASRTDTGTPSDSGGGTDTGSDTGTPDTGSDTGVDAGPTLTSTVGNTGTIFIGHDAVFGEFYEDDTILHWSNAATCVAFVRSPTKMASVAGTLTVGGQIVGTDGGTEQTITIDADPMGGNTYFAPPPIFASVDTHTLTVQLTARPPAFAAMPVDTFRPPREAPVAITAPPAPDGGVLPPIPSTAPYVITWTPPTGGFVNEQHISFGLTVSGSGGVGAKNTRLFCTFPLNAGTATIPANVLAELKTRGGGSVPLDTKVKIFAGTAKEVKTATGSYFVEVVRTDSTSIEFEQDAKLQ